MLNIINILLCLLLRNPPFIKDINAEFPLHPQFERQYRAIKNEFMQYDGNIQCFREKNPLLNNIDTIDSDRDYCWRTLYVKVVGNVIYDETTRHFPETLKLIQSDQIHNAFFSILDPHVEIKPHTGYYKGYLRYHIGIIIPEENGKRPYIICGGEKYEWREGKGVMFDDMYLHYVKNPTNQKCVVLYLDVKRENNGFVVDLLTRIGNWLSDNSIVISQGLKNQHTQDSIDP